ncbi:MAG: DNA translocase FtsK [Cytophagales bacterium]|nr:MAG: DNA translocase FtsK [Cytophagales bacterium]
MAENTYKKNTPKKENTRVKENTIAGQEKTEAPKFQTNFLKDKRFHLSLGFFLALLAISMLFAILSYLFTGKDDQSVVESIFDTTIIESGQEVQNWLGIFGATMAYFLVFKWFGISAFFFVPIITIISLRLLLAKKIGRLKILSLVSFFFIFWLGLVLGYIALKLDGENYITYIAGGIGYELALIVDSIAGWGTAFILLFMIIIFIIYYFNITSISPKLTEPIKENPSIAESTSSLENNLLTVENNQENELLPTDNVPNPDLEIISDKEEAVEEEEEWVLKKTEAVKPKLKTEPVFNIDEAFAALAEQQAKDSIGLDDLGKDVVQDKFVTPSPEDIPLDGEKIANYDPTLDLPHYQYPPVELLNEFDGNKVQVTKEELEANKDKIVDTLKNYNIGISSIKATIGPTVTLYEIVPDAGIRISKIKSLEDDIALNLAALGIRIIAPMPGKGTIGIEVPNLNREMVAMKSVLSTEKFLKSDKELPVVFGKTISNEVFVVDLAKMPHLLMAGATGQGKSVGLNVLLASLIFKKHPSQLKFVLVDPKKVELSLFNKIERHFLAKLPDTEEAIITDTKKVVHTLNSLCIEMDMRYDLLKEANCRNLKEYNQKFIERRLNPNNGHRFMPYIVLVIDELADLMMTAGKEVETPIARLAQLARAIGIHLVVATQRPSVNVITGIIKANFPARLSFKVTSKIDSRTILDTGGADQLVGQGDMLFSNGSDLIRLQCAFLDTPEVERVCDFIGSQRGYDHPYHLPEFSDEDMVEDKSNGEFKFSERDKMFEEAARIIVTHQQGSTSLLQRRLKLGYNRAGRLIDQLESAGIVGAFEGSKAREVLIKDDYSLEQLLTELAKNG